MTTLGNRTRSVVRDSGDRHKRISHMFLAWYTEDGKVGCALGCEDVYGEDLEFFVETAINTLQKALKKR
jgi:hypothetical protein